MTILETVGLTRRFGKLTAVDGLNLAVAEGEVFGLLGPNGAGKTTVIKILTTLLPPTAGTATVAGFDVRRHPAQVRASIGYVPQLISVDGALTGYENLLIFAKLYGVPRAVRGSRIAEALNSAELQEAAGREVRGYSGGMVRRLELAMAMLHRPRVLFLDEPTVGSGPGGAAGGVAADAVAGAGVRHDHFPDHPFHGRGGYSLRAGGDNESWPDCGLGPAGRIEASHPTARGDVGRSVRPFHRQSLETEHEGNYRGISQTRRNLARLG